MDKISDYQGNLFSHVAAVYRPGERDIAVEFVEALGCVAVDTPGMADSGSPFMAIHPEPDDRDMLNNLFYLSEMMPQQLALEQAMQRQIEQDTGLRDLYRTFGETALASPASVPHFALNFPSRDAIEPVISKLENLRPALAERVRMQVWRPGDPGAFAPNCTMAFVYTDIIAGNVGGLGQIIELQGRPRKFTRG